MLSGKHISVDYIVERLHHDYGFDNITLSDILEYIWDVVGFIGVLDPMIDKEPL